MEALERKRQNDRVAGNVQGHSGIRMEKSWTFPSLRCGMPWAAMSLQALLGVVRHLVVERIGVDVNYEVVRHLFGLLGSGWVELAGLRHPIRPWQERVHNLIGELAGVGHLGQQPLDVKPGIEPVGLGRGGDAVYRRRRPRAARRIAEEPVLAPYDEDSLGLLGDVVRELQVPRLRARS